MRPSNLFERGSAEAFAHLDAMLAPEWSLLWETRIGTGRADVIALHPTHGVVVVEAKDWQLQAQPPRFLLERTDSAATSTAGTWRVLQRAEGTSARKAVPEPFTQLAEYAAIIRTALGPTTAPAVRGLFLSSAAPRERAQQFFHPVWEEIRDQHGLQIFTRGADDIAARTVHEAGCFTAPVPDDCGWFAAHNALVDELVPFAKRVRRGSHAHWTRRSA